MVRYVVRVKLSALEGEFWLWRGALVTNIRKARKYAYPGQAEKSAKRYAENHPETESVTVCDYP